jgi:MoaA/NifB/PqqE/SkfB family radical SAM enzyme
MPWSQLNRKVRGIHRRYREARMIAAALKAPHRPILAQIIPIRRCNLSCAYCNEYDKTSAPVPIEEMLRRIDQLAALGTTAITFSGGEPLLHPELETIVRRIRQHGIIATLITNGYLLTAERIKRLNRAGLDYLQISVDNVTPDEVSKKSLKVLDQKLRWLAEHAEFEVTINSVLGSSIRQPEDALAVAPGARTGLQRDGRRHSRPHRPIAAAR